MKMPKMNNVLDSFFTVLKNGSKTAVQLALGREAVRNIMKGVYKYIPPLRQVCIDRPAMQAVVETITASGVVFMLTLVEDQLDERKRKIVRHAAEAAALAAATSATSIVNLEGFFDMLIGKDPLKESERILKEAREIE